MITISHKTKQFFLVTIKILIVCGAIYYIYWHFAGDKNIHFNEIKAYFSFKMVLILMVLSGLNWFFEILKWKHLVSSFQTISFLKAAEQSLGSLTAAVFTPNRLGEYGAKALYFNKENNKQIVFLNFLGNGSQMLVTTFFGVLGFFLSSITSSTSMFWFSSKINLKILLPTLFIFFALMYYFKNMEFYGFSLKKLIKKIGSFSIKFHLINLFFSAFRYLLFSFQFLLLLTVFDIEIALKTAIATIFIMYFLASIIPAINFMDVAIKGSVALFLFSLLQVNEMKIASIVAIMWVFNLVIPLLIGCFCVWRFKPIVR